MNDFEKLRASSFILIAEVKKQEKQTLLSIGLGVLVGGIIFYLIR